ncbi:MAG: DUF2460 domain-containing protein [Pseudomonadota bacterium]
MSNFHEIRFPTALSRGASGGPERRTQIVTLGSGHEERNARWADSRRTYNAGYGVRTVDDLHEIIAFFEERRGSLHGFRWRDHADWRSQAPGRSISPLDQTIGVGDGVRTEFQLVKQYGRDFAPHVREITKPIDGSVRIALDGIETTEPDAFSVDAGTGVVTLSVAPAPDVIVTAGFDFDVPVRFASDRLELTLECVTHGAIPSIPVVEIRV